MDLLEKFESIEIRQDSRISDADRCFCEAHQSAYEHASAALQELEYFWDDMLAQQRELLEPAGDAPTAYLLSHGGLDLSGGVIREQARNLHSLFIRKLAGYFSRTYHFSISAEEIEKRLLPQEPADRQADNYRELCLRYARDLQELSLSYSDILEQVFLQTGGRAFAEQALSELKAGCRRAAWGASGKQASYARKKCTIQFTRHACCFRSYYRAEGSWDMSSGMRAVMKGIAYFETGSLSTVPDAFSRLINGHYLESCSHDFPGCRKIRSLKMYKNGRVDVRFREEAHAIQFAAEYLGTVPPCE